MQHEYITDRFSSSDLASKFYLREICCTHQVKSFVISSLTSYTKNTHVLTTFRERRKKVFNSCKNGPKWY